MAPQERADLPVPVVVHPHVRGVAVGVAAEPGAAPAPRPVVLGRAKAAHHVQPPRGYALGAQLLDDQLQLVHQPQVQRQVLGPHRRLVLGQELAQLVDLMASRLGVEDREKPELDDIKEEVAPVAVLRTIDEAEQNGTNSG